MSDALRQVRCPVCNRWVAEFVGSRLRVICKGCGEGVSVLDGDAGKTVIIALGRTPRRAVD